MFREFAEWLSMTGLSVWLQSHAPVVPISQSIHIVGIGLLFTSVMTINARLLGVRAAGPSVSGLVHTLMPLARWSLVALFLTGVVQTISEPVRQFVAPMYWAKMLSIIVALFLTRLFARSVKADAARWDDDERRPGSARAFAIATSLLWVTIIFFGRFIGYTWFYHT